MAASVQTAANATISDADLASTAFITADLKLATLDKKFSVMESKLPLDCVRGFAPVCGAAKFSSMGFLQKIPTEIRIEILLYLPIVDLLKFRSLSRAARAIVDGIYEFRMVVTHCSNAIRAVVAMGITTIGISQIYKGLCQTQCSSKNCTNMGTHFYYPTAKRVCDICIKTTNRLAYKPMNIKIACLYTGLTVDQVIADFTTFTPPGSFPFKDTLNTLLLFVDRATVYKDENTLARLADANCVEVTALGAIDEAPAPRDMARVFGKRWFTITAPVLVRHPTKGHWTSEPTYYCKACRAHEDTANDGRFGTYHHIRPSNQEDDAADEVERLPLTTAFTRTQFAAHVAEYGPAEKIIPPPRPAPVWLPRTPPNNRIRSWYSNGIHYSLAPPSRPPPRGPATPFTPPRPRWDLTNTPPALVGSLTPAIIQALGHPPAWNRPSSVGTGLGGVGSGGSTGFSASSSMVTGFNGLGGGGGLAASSNTVTNNIQQALVQLVPAPPSLGWSAGVPSAFLLAPPPVGVGPPARPSPALMISLADFNQLKASQLMNKHIE